MEFPTIEEFARQYDYAIDDPGVRRAYDAALAAEREHVSFKRFWDRVTREAGAEAYEEGRAEGIKEGIIEGRADERARMVEGMVAAGIPREQALAIADGASSKSTIQ